MKDTGRQFILTFMSTILKPFWQRQSTLARNVSKNSKVVHAHPSHFAATRSAMVSAWWGPTDTTQLTQSPCLLWPQRTSQSTHPMSLSGVSGHGLLRRKCPLMAQSGHSHLPTFSRCSFDHLMRAAGPLLSWRDERFPFFNDINRVQFDGLVSRPFIVNGAVGKC